MKQEPVIDSILKEIVRIIREDPVRDRWLYRLVFKKAEKEPS